MDIITTGWAAVLSFFMLSIAFVVWGRGGM